jgi:RNA polymerase sigma factor (sigma-70 family)
MCEYLTVVRKVVSNLIYPKGMYEELIQQGYLLALQSPNKDKAYLYLRVRSKLIRYLCYQHTIRPPEGEQPMRRETLQTQKHDRPKDPEPDLLETITLNETERLLAEMLMEGYSQSEIARRLGINKMKISRIVKRIREKYETAFPDAGA